MCVCVCVCVCVCCFHQTFLRVITNAAKLNTPNYFNIGVLGYIGVL